MFVVVTLGGLLLRTRAKLRRMRFVCAGYERRRAEALAVLDTVPLAAFRWPTGRDDDGYSVQTVAYPKFLAELASGDAGNSRRHGSCCTAMASHSRCLSD